MIDIHAHFFTDRSGRNDWQRLNRRRLEVGDTMGITCHVASILGSWGATSPTYFPSTDDLDHANASMAELVATSGGKIAGYCVVNPNYPDHALDALGLGLARGLIGVKLAASRRANDTLLDPIAAFAGEHSAPILHHIWQHRRRDWPGQEASDAVELADLARRHPTTNFILAHIGGGGEWSHSLRAIGTVKNIFVDLSGSGVDQGMVEAVFAAVGVARTVWGCDVTLDTGLAKLRYLRSILPAEDVDQVISGNARHLFARGHFS